MKTAVFLNTLAKMVNYDLNELSNYDIKNIAIISDDEYDKFNQKYKKYFHKILSCKNEAANKFDKIPYQFAKDVIQNQINLGDDVRIICLSEDNLLLAAKLRDEFNIHGLKYENTLLFRDKILMKEALQSKGICTPRYYKFDDKKAGNAESYFEHLQNLVGLPFVLKPTRMLGSLGVTIINSLPEFLNFYQHSLLDLDYEVEEFISGTLYHCDSIRRDNRTIFSVCCEYTNPNFDFLKGKSVISMPLPANDPLTKKIMDFNEKVLEALNLEQGISHHEIFLTYNNELVFLEIAARSPGAIATPMYRQAFNIGLEDIDYKMQLKIPFELKPIYEINYLSGIFPVKPGIITKLNSPELESEFEMDWVVQRGDQVGLGTSLRDKSSTIMAWNKNYQALRNDFYLLKNFQTLSVQEA